MERDEIKFDQKRWSKRDHRKSNSLNIDEPSDDHLLFDLSLEEEQVVENEYHHEIYTPHKSEGKMPGPIISPPSKIRKDKEDYQLAENRRRMSSFRKEAATMHEHSDEKMDEGSTFESSTEVKEADWKRRPQANPFLAEILSMLEDSQSSDWSYVEEQLESTEENPFEEHSILTDIVSSLNEQNSFKNPYHLPQTSRTENDEVVFSEELTMKEESPIQEDGGDEELSKENSLLISEVFSLFDESSSCMDELEETLEEDSSSSADLSSLSEERLECPLEEKWQEESSSESSFCLPELEESSSSQENFSDKKDQCVDPPEKIVVKVPVLLSCVTVDIDLMETLNVPTDICEIIDIELSLQSIETRVVSPSCFAFISGVIRAEVQYNNGDSVQLLTLPIPWKKVVPVEWQRRPLLPYSNKKEYFFGADGAQEENLHMEFYQTFTDSVESEGLSVRFVSHHESISNGEFYIQGTAQLVINLLQQQYVNL